MYNRPSLFGDFVAWLITQMLFVCFVDPPIEDYILSICRVFKGTSEYKCRQITTNIYARRLRLRFGR